MLMDQLAHVFIKKKAMNKTKTQIEVDFLRKSTLFGVRIKKNKKKVSPL